MSLTNFFKRLPIRDFMRPPSRTVSTTIPRHQIPQTNPSTGSETSDLYEPDKLYSAVELEVRGHDPAVLKSYAWFLQTAADHLELQVTKNTALRKPEKERLSLLQCVHIYKKHMAQYEMRTYYRFFNLKNLTGSTADTYLEYVERNLPEGVALKVTKVQLHGLPEHVNESISQQVKDQSKE